MTLLDILMRYADHLIPSGRATRRAALEAMTPDELETEARSLIGGRPWMDWERVLEERAAFDALGTGPEARL